MFNRSEIMKAAWANWIEFKRIREARGRPYAFNRSEFGWCLARAWSAAKFAALTATEQRRETIKGEIDALSFKPLRINVEPRRSALAAELAGIAA